MGTTTKSDAGFQTQPTQTETQGASKSKIQLTGFSDDMLEQIKQQVQSLTGVTWVEQNNTIEGSPNTLVDCLMHGISAESPNTYSGFDYQPGDTATDFNTPPSEYRS